MTKASGDVVLLRTYDGGRWIWCKPLQIIEFIKFRQHRAAAKDTFPLNKSQNTMDGAYKKALRCELNRVGG